MIRTPWSFNWFPIPVAVVLVALMPSLVSAQQNTVGISIDTSVKGQITAFGSYTTKPGITLTKITVWAFPTSGGLMPAQTDTKDIGNGAWGKAGMCILKTRVFKGTYAVRADGLFSDQTTFSSSYVISTVDGDAMPAPPTLDISFSGGSPSSATFPTITAAGVYTGNFNAKGTGVIWATPQTGGKLFEGSIKNNATLKTWSGSVNVDTGGITYSIIAWAGDNGANQLYYCTAFCQIVVPTAQ